MQTMGIVFINLARGGAVGARRAHNPKVVVESNPATKSQ